VIIKDAYDWEVNQSGRLVVVDENDLLHYFAAGKWSRVYCTPDDVVDEPVVFGGPQVSIVKDSEVKYYRTVNDPDAEPGGTPDRYRG